MQLSPVSRNAPREHTPQHYVLSETCAGRLAKEHKAAREQRARAGELAVKLEGALRDQRRLAAQLGQVQAGSGRLALRGVLANAPPSRTVTVPAPPGLQPHARRLQRPMFCRVMSRATHREGCAPIHTVI